MHETISKLTVIKAITTNQTKQVLLLQTDPGRLLYACTIGSRLNLEPGEALSLDGRHSHAIVRWLHGLPGMNFDMLPYADIDFSKFRYKAATIKHFKKQGADIEHPETISPHAFYIIPGSNRKSPAASPPPPAYSSLGVSGLEKSFANTTIRDASSPNPYLKPAPPPPPRRRAPSPASLPRARVIHNFSSQDAGELDVQAGQIVEVLKDLGDGWLKARLPDGKLGIVPQSYTVVM